MASPAIFEPERIRALAHPTRLDLLAHLGEVGQASATQCAPEVGESVASCSFHLRMLAKYGFIERAPARGREKPWRLVAQGGWDVRSSEAPGSRSATAHLATVTIEREAQRLRQFLAQLQVESPAWAAAVTVTTSGFWASATEMAELAEQVRSLTTRFAQREDEPGLRPPGARHGRLLATLNPDPVDPGDLVDPGGPGE